MGQQFGALTFNFGLITACNISRKLVPIYFKIYLRNHSILRNYRKLASSFNRISLRLLNLKFLKNIKSLDLLQLKSNKDFHELESTIQKKDINFLRGFIHDQPYSIFRKFFTKIKAYFEVSSIYTPKINEPLENLKDNDVIIGVAIRHGDYKHGRMEDYLPAKTIKMDGKS